MNYHFLSFLLDVATWIAFSLLLGRILTDLENYEKREKIKTSSILLLVALCSGCFSVMTHGLPDTGFAWSSFVTVGIVTFIQAQFLSKKLRDKSKEALIIFLSFVTSVIHDVKGGVEYGNSR